MRYKRTEEVFSCSWRAQPVCEGGGHWKNRKQVRSDGEKFKAGDPGMTNLEYENFLTAIMLAYPPVSCHHRQKSFRDGS